MGDQVTDSNVSTEPNVKPPWVKRAEELVCWVNRWGDNATYQCSTDWHQGYRQAMSDVLPKAMELGPDWLDTWREQIKERERVS